MWLYLRWRTSNTYYFIEVTGNETVADLKALLDTRYALKIAVVAFQNQSLTHERLKDVPGLANLGSLRIEPAAGSAVVPGASGGPTPGATAPAPAAAPARNANPPPPSAANPPPPKAANPPPPAAARPPPAAPAPAPAARPPPAAAAAPAITATSENTAAQQAFNAMTNAQKADITALRQAYPALHQTFVVSTYVACEYNRDTAASVLAFD
jgi:hypothetical protein